ncbi:transcriptional regulator [Magnetospirillum sp. ME-1]|uniref:helix-turn-helix transcriptional regulator n=1 Tax=Magnetospirillum sp. ME-1 TaxID=1639348 RepID=UPI000A17F9AC|nr:transcriptional regulator [Magnetospirillum sp. ME-1]
MPLTATQCRMARAALQIGVRDLAQLAKVSPNTIARLERGETLYARTLDTIRATLEAAGVMIIDADENGGDGVRVRREE